MRETQQMSERTGLVTADELARLPEWKLRDGKLSRAVEFHNYMEGPLFAVKVGHLAEELNHHPEIHIGYKKMWIEMNTHDVDGISPYDFELARNVDTLL